MIDKKYSLKLARHEAAHFVVAWAIECPIYSVDITPAAHKTCDDGYEIIGRAYSMSGRPTAFEHILGDLAGPVADYYQHDSSKILEIMWNEIECCVARTIECGWCLDQDGSDLDSCLWHLMGAGYVDIRNEEQLKEMLIWFLDATRAILKVCETQWFEVTEHLVRHGRIGFSGGHPDQGEGAEEFFFRWSENWGQPPENIRSLVSAFRDSDRLRADVGSAHPD